MTEEELQDPANWMMEEAISRAPVKSPRSIVSVSFPAEDLARISDAARENGMKTSEFIRNAALAEAHRKHRRRLDLFAGGASHGVFTVLPANWRRGGKARLVIRRMPDSDKQTG